MLFRKDSLLFYELQIIAIVIAVLCLAMIPFLEAELALLCALMFLIFVIIIFINPRIYNEYIIINEIGISCQKAGKQIWAYKWDEIVALQKGSRSRLPSMEIVVPSPCRALDSCRDIEHARCSGDYFQLCKAAKKALEQYYKPKENPVK